MSAMRSMLNKMTQKTYQKFVNSTKELTYESPEIISMIFKKIVEDQTNTEVYVNFCTELYDMTIFSDICLEQFTISSKQKELCKFIASLYNKAVIHDLQVYVNLIYENIESGSDKNNSDSFKIISYNQLIVSKSNFIINYKDIHLILCLFPILYLAYLGLIQEY